MKLCYYKILLFSLALNILVSSSYENNKNKSYITPRHTPTITSRGKNFDRQTSQRFEEYEQRMITNRQKCKEQCDKDIKQIIVKDKIEKSLEEKVEKCCLNVGGVLGGGVAPAWGLISGLVYAGWSHYVSAVAEKAATNAGVRAGFEGLRDFFF
ncbi:PIR protein, putative [Plasmodium sp.]|nr:PIR protein, putative [Plasmodium sp.]